jgi:hypothetical protein
MTTVLQEKLNLPVSCTSDGKMVSLREFVKNKNQDNSILSLSSLAPRQRAKITAERLRRRSEVQLASLGAGLISKERAIAEVESLTPLGQSLIEADQYVIKRLIDELEHGRLKGMIE